LVFKVAKVAGEPTLGLDLPVDALGSRVGEVKAQERLDLRPPGGDGFGEPFGLGQRLLAAQW